MADEVGDFFRDVSDGIGDAVRDVSDAVGDVVRDVSDAVGDVVRDVSDGVGDVLRDVFDDPVTAIAKIAAVATGQVWALPLIDGAATLANGGDIGDALKSAAISYASTVVGGTVGEVVGQATASATGSAVVGQIVGSGAGRASVALVMGQDPVQAFISGGVNAGISAAAGWIEQQGIESGAGNVWTNLPDAAQNVISSSLGAALSGQDITEEVLWNAVLSTESVAKTVNGFLEKNTGLTDGQISALTLGIQRTAAVAFSGGDVPQAIQSQLDNYARDQFKDWFDDTKAGIAINNTMDKITGDYQRAAAQADALDELSEEYNDTIAAYKSTVTEINTGVGRTNELKTAYDRALQNFQANESQANADALTAAVDAYNEHVTTFNKRYEDVLKPNLDYYETRVPQLDAQFAAEKQTYLDFVDDLSVTSDQLNDELTPMYEELDKTFVRFMDPDFNEAEYRAIAGLGADEDAYMHWLSTGKEQGLPTNKAAYQEEYGAYRQQIINSTLDSAGISLSNMTQFERAAFLADIDERYPTLQALKFAPTQTLADELLTNQSIADRAAANGYIAGQTRITPEINDALERAGISPGMVGEYLTQEDVQALTTPRLQTPEEIVRPADITDADIANGSARLTVNDDGLLEWGRIEMDVPYWDPDLNRLVKRSYVEQGTYLDGSYVVVDALSGERVDNVLRMEITPPPSLLDTRNTDPNLFVQTVGGLTEAAGAVIDTQVGQAVSEFARNAVSYVESLPGGAEALQDKKDAILTTAGLTAQLGGELLDSFNGLFIYANIDPKSTPFAGWADDLITLSTQLKTEEWQEAYDRADMRRRGIDPATGQLIEREFSRLNALTDFVGAIEEAPVQFIAEAIGVEVGQEVISWLLGGAATKVAQVGARAMGREIGEAMATRITAGSVFALDIAESAGGAASGAYDEALATALNAGMGQDDAQSYAAEIAKNAGLIAATMTVASAGIGGNDFERLMLGVDKPGAVANAFDFLADRVATGASVSIKEGVQEAIEEGLPSLYVETALAQIDPNRGDILDAVARDALFGAVVGAGTAGSMYTGDVAADVLIRTNATIRNAISSGGASNPEATKEALAGLGLGEVVQNNLLSTVNDQYHSTGEVSRAFSAHPDFVVGNSDVLNGVLNSVGTDVTTYVNTYVDQRYVDIAEVKAAAAAEGVTLTDEQAQKYVTQTDSPDATTAALYSIQQEYDPQYTSSDEAINMLRDLDFNTSPFGGGWNNLGKNINWQQETAKQFEGMAEAEARDAVAAYVDPRQVTEAEARKLFEDMGYTPTQEEIDAYVGQSYTDENFAAGQESAVKAYVDPRQVTEAEARAFFQEQGYNPTDEEVAQFVRQQAESTVQAELNTYADQNMVSAEEAKAAYEALGLTRPTQADLDALVGQYSEADLAGRAEENLPAARYNSIIEQIEGLSTQSGAGPEVTEAIETVKADLQNQMESLGFKFDESTGEMLDAIAASEDRLLEQITANEEAGMARDEAIQEALSTIAGDLGTTEQTLLERIGETEESLNTKVDDLATQITDVQTSVLERVQELEDAGVARDDALDQAIADVATSLGTTEESLLEQIGSTQESLAGDISALEASLTGQITDVQTSVLERVQELEDAGVARDDALDQAIADVATSLGTTEESLLEQIGATQETLAADISALEASLTGQITDVQTSVLERVQELEDAGVDRDTALQTAIDEVAGNLGTTREEMLAQIGETEESLLTQIGDLETQIGDVEAGLLDRVQELEDAGIDRDTALQTAIDEVSGDLGTTREDLLTQIGKTEDTLLTQLADIESGLQEQVSGVEATLLDRVQELEDAGIARDDALQTALGELSTQLGTTEEGLLAQIGETEASILDQISTARDEFTRGLTDVATTLAEQAAQYEAAGIARDQALSQAVDDVAADLGTTRADLLAQIGETEQSILTTVGEQITGVEGQLAGFKATTSADIDYISNLIGKPARDVTQVDVDFVADLIAQQEVVNELSRAQQQYDVTGDGIIDQTDYALLQQAIAGQDVTFAPTSAFGPATGIYAQQEQNLAAQLAAEQQTQQQIEQATQQQIENQTQLATQLQTQIQTEADAAQRRALSDYLLGQEDLYGQRVDVRTPDPMRINYFYDFSDIFATPQQAGMFPSPYAKGGQVDDITDKLLRIIGD